MKRGRDDQDPAVELFQVVLRCMGVDSSDRVTPTSLDERIELVSKLYKHALRRSDLRDQLFMQISTQTRNNPDGHSLIKAWEVMHLCAGCMPPSEEIGGYLSEYVHTVARSASSDSKVQVLAMRTLKALKRSVKAGPRHTIPGREEIDAVLTSKKLTTIVFFLDETFEEITYDMATTVADAVEELAGIIKLSAYSGFSLFECRTAVVVSKSPDPGNEEYIGLDGNKYIGDLLADFKASKDRSEEGILHRKLIFKKKLFLESDEAVTDPMFVQLMYVQLQHDYVLGNYPVGRDDAAQLSALQILVEIGYVVSPETCTTWTSLLERFIPCQIAIAGAKRDWEHDVLSRYRSMENLTKDDARQQFLRILTTLPYGNSLFFAVRTIDDPILLLPGEIILGVNKRGVHFFRPVPKECVHLMELSCIQKFGSVPKECVHSVELSCIQKFGSNDTVVSFKMRVAGGFHTFDFETRQGKEICAALEAHIGDIMRSRCSKAPAAANDSIRVHPSDNVRPRTVDINEKRVLELLKSLEESKNKVSQLQKDLHEKQNQELKLKKDRDKLRTLCDEKDSALQAALLEKQSIEVKPAKLNSQGLEDNIRKELVESNEQELKSIQPVRRRVSHRAQVDPKD